MASFAFCGAIPGRFHDSTTELVVVRFEGAKAKAFMSSQPDRKQTRLPSGPRHHTGELYVARANDEGNSVGKRIFISFADYQEMMARDPHYKSRKVEYFSKSHSDNLSLMEPGDTLHDPEDGHIVVEIGLSGELVFPEPVRPSPAAGVQVRIRKTLGIGSWLSWLRSSRAQNLLPQVK